MNISEKLSLEMNVALDEYQAEIERLTVNNTDLAFRLSQYEQPVRAINIDNFPDYLQPQAG